MEGVPQKKFSSSEEEIAFLRAEIAKREKEALSRNKELDSVDIETIGKGTLREYGEYESDVLLTKKNKISEEEISNSVESISTTVLDKSEEIFKLAKEKGIKNALTVLQKIGDAHLTDEVHRAIVTDLHSGKKIADLKEGMPVFKILDMTLFEVSLPEHVSEGEEITLTSLMSAMEQFYAGMRTLGSSKIPSHYTLEIAVSNNQDHIIFYTAVPTKFINLFEKQILSLFPSAILYEQKNDYNIFVENGVSLVSVAKQKKHPIYPIRTHDKFENDPMNVLLNSFSKIERNGGGASIQLVVNAGHKEYKNTYNEIIKKVKDGVKPKTAIKRSTVGGEIYESFKNIAFSNDKKDDSSFNNVDNEALEIFQHKTESPVIATNLRIAVSSGDESSAEQILLEIESSFHQFEDTDGNKIVFDRVYGSRKKRELKAFSFREYIKQDTMPLSLSEISTLIHFPAEGVESAPQFKQSRAKSAPAPLDMPNHGTLLGQNDYRNKITDIYITPEDRLRHFYIIGQTGTGKTVLMKNMIIQDIFNGAGVCMIDPHGTDIEDVLSIIPDERKDDVIYFDPSRTDMVMGLNMLEYDTDYPEQKTFVINELFSIFQKLYGGNPESMGPIFEQYFRNSTALVLEDPASGSTLLDVSRVMVDAEFRKNKLKKSRNQVVNQFWNKIATKAGGEASLENIVPYITSKFDVFTANDFMRPIIGQQKSAFNFRKIMDEKKILLVNLSKGRLGDINANLIGMIFVGKILMAALSRVDDPTKSFPPFYLHIDEFQNVTTDSISSILSEARKYKLGLTIAHQYIAQLDEGIRDAVFGNVGSVASFRVGPEDSEFLAHQFEPVFSSSDLMNIENWNAYVRVLSDGTPTRPFNIHTMVPPKWNHARVQEIIEHSYKKYATPRRRVEMEISARYHK